MAVPLGILRDGNVRKFPAIPSNHGGQAKNVINWKHLMALEDECWSGTPYSNRV